MKLKTDFYRVNYCIDDMIDGYADFKTESEAMQYYENIKKQNPDLSKETTFTLSFVSWEMRLD